ncbi:hypothetical protein [Arthrobacter sp. UYEF3]|uniref:hypothetical protein n=1 Tax=Arthrobacter sp. UYEF3 TaxID=1756365 RepID=UPI0033927861
MNEPTGAAADAATILSNLPDYRVVSTTVTTGGRRQVIFETDQPLGCPSCGLIACSSHLRVLSALGGSWGIEFVSLKTRGPVALLG